MSENDGSARALPDAEAVRAVPEATVGRLAVYLRVLGTLVESGVGTVSSEQLAAGAGVGSAKLRKDLSFLGSTGTRGVGYDVGRLVARLEHVLGLTRRHDVALVGVGNLGQALVGYDGFGQRGFPVTALFDVDPARVGTEVGGLVVHHLDELARVCAALQITIGVIATPPAGAQPVADRFVAAGVRCILNFAPVVLAVPDTVDVRKVDLAVEMQVLSFHVARREATAQAAGSAPGEPRSTGTGAPGTEPGHEPDQGTEAPRPPRAGARTPAAGRSRPTRTTSRRNGPVIVP